MMNELQLILPLFLLLGSTISLWLASQAWKHRPEPWAPLLTLLMVTISWWSLFNAFELNSFRLEQKLFWINVQYIGIALLPVTFWAFAMAYSGRTVWLSGRRLPLMLLIPFLTILISWTNIGQLMRTDIALQEVAGIPVFRSVRGPWFGVYLTYTYVLLLWGVGLLIEQWRQATARWRKNQAAVLVLACLIPIVASIMTQFAVVPFELSTFAFLITGLLISWGMFRLRLFDIAPIARRIMTSSMSDGMIALDHHGRIVDANLAALNVLGRSLDNVIGRTLDEMLDGNTLNLDVGPQMGSGEYELILEQKDNKHYYDVRISPLKDIWRQFQGNLVVLRDVTSQRKSSQDLLKQKRLLEQLVLVARITTEKADLQNTLLNTLTVMASLTESHAGSLLLLDKRLQITHCLYSDESHQSVVISPEQFPHRVVKEGLAGWVIREKECALVHDTAVD
ncbi:MAG: PAS domain-containing protein, partial [Anaerolineales bacterium]|nr:PAS domain-containing protein [Anaerolineales bacterium]